MGKKVNKTTGHDDPRSRLVSVSALLEEPAIRAMIVEYSRPAVLDAIHGVLDRLRNRAAQDQELPGTGDIAEEIRAALAGSESERLRPVVNATGIILHTGLGRAVLPKRAANALAGLDRCCNMQIDLETGKRGKRNFMTERLLQRLTGAEAAMVVNNNAAATLLILAALCAGKEVIISRGQLIEIGGSYRLPDCIRHSGAVMVEVGTTNKTHLYDYERALTENTGMILHVNPSNYRIVGFSEQVPIGDLLRLKKKQPVLVMDDLGCGALVNMAQYGLPDEPTVPESIAAGADIVCFSGDKLIGGPQAGIIVGKKDLIAAIKKHPLTRMLRVCKLTDLALEQTLRLFLEPERLPEVHPTYRMLTVPLETLRKRALSLKKKIDGVPGALHVRVVEGESETGGGSMPAVPIKTWVLAVRAGNLSPDRLSFLLRQHEPPVIARIRNDEVLLDMRTILEGEEKIVLGALEDINHSKPLK
ncbi:L-seryl-tRNA(Sec) selenium transferase [bacterium]|nr:L-seryl-tRNA(Sec) selenium transferase [bacterium]